MCRRARTTPAAAAVTIVLLCALIPLAAASAPLSSCPRATAVASFAPRAVCLCGHAPAKPPPAIEQVTPAPALKPVTPVPALEPVMPVPTQRLVIPAPALEPVKATQERVSSARTGAAAPEAFAPPDDALDLGTLAADLRRSVLVLGWAAAARARRRAEALAREAAGAGAAAAETARAAAETARAAAELARVPTRGELRDGASAAWQRVPERAAVVGAAVGAAAVVLERSGAAVGGAAGLAGVARERSAVARELAVGAVGMAGERSTFLKERAAAVLEEVAGVVWKRARVRTGEVLMNAEALTERLSSSMDGTAKDWLAVAVDAVREKSALVRAWAAVGPAWAGERAAVLTERMTGMLGQAPDVVRELARMRMNEARGGAEALKERVVRSSEATAISALTLAAMVDAKSTAAWQASVTRLEQAKGSGGALSASAGARARISMTAALRDTKNRALRARIYCRDALMFSLSKSNDTATRVAASATRFLAKCTGSSDVLVLLVQQFSDSAAGFSLRLLFALSSFFCNVLWRVKIAVFFIVIVALLFVVSEVRRYLYPIQLAFTILLRMLRRLGAITGVYTDKVGNKVLGPSQTLEDAMKDSFSAENDHRAPSRAMRRLRSTRLQGISPKGSLHPNAPRTVVKEPATRRMHIVRVHYHNENAFRVNAFRYRTNESRIPRRRTLATRARQPRHELEVVVQE